MEPQVQIEAVIKKMIITAFSPVMGMSSEEYLEYQKSTHLIALTQARVDEKYFSMLGSKEVVGSEIHPPQAQNLPPVKMDITAQDALKDTRKKIDKEKMILKAIEEIKKTYE